MKRKRIAPALRGPGSAAAPQPLQHRLGWQIAALAAVAFGLRVYDLEHLPIAGDESVYVRWAEIIVHQKQFFISLLDGKQPLSYWLYALTRLVGEDDPLWGPRFISALAGTLSTLGIFAIGRRLAGPTAGFVAGALYAVFPYALLYDRLAYTESLVNLAGVAIVWASLACCGEEREGWRSAVLLGLALGLGFFIKSTAALFAFFPVVAALGLKGPRRWTRLAVAYGIAAVFPLVSWVSVPRAPMMQTHNLLVHQTSFFVPPRELLAHPFAAAPANLRALAEYTGAYLTWPLAAAGLAALGYLAWRRSGGVVAVASVAVLPLAVQVFILVQRPSRYPFPHFWPWLVLIGMAVEALRQESRVRQWAVVGVAVVALPGGCADVCGVGSGGGLRDCRGGSVLAAGGAAGTAGGVHGSDLGAAGGRHVRLRERAERDSRLRGVVDDDLAGLSDRAAGADRGAEVAVRAGGGGDARPAGVAAGLLRDRNAVHAGGGGGAAGAPCAAGGGVRKAEWAECD